MFGCKRHDGKYFWQHSDEEKREDGMIEIGPGMWKSGSPSAHGNTTDDVSSNPALVPSYRAFDSGCIPDLHCEEGEAVWKKLGKQYVPHVGPVITNNAELKDYMRITNHHFHDASKMVEVEERPGAFGYDRKRKRKKRDHGDFEPTFGTFRRDPNDFNDGKKRAREQVEIDRAAHAAKERARHKTKKYFFT